MTFTKSLLALAFTGLVFTGCKDAAKSGETATETNETAVKTDVPVGKIETASFSIEGMTCSMGCAKTIEKKLAKLDGVQSATVDFEKKTATVSFDTGKQTPEQLAKTVESAADGKTYKVSAVKSSGDHAMLIDKDKKNKKKAEKSDAKNADAKSGDKPACCAKKKACNKEKATI